MAANIEERYPSETVDQGILGQSLELPVSKLTAKNRILKAALTERMATWDQQDIERRGIPTDELVHLYEVWGNSGFGIIASMCFTPNYRSLHLFDI